MSTGYSFDESILSELHKDARGFRPREGFWQHWNESTMDGKQSIWDGLIRELDEEMERQREAHERAIVAFETRITDTISVGAGDRATAIRWILQAMDLSEHDLRYGGSYVCYELGLPYSMESEFNDICKEMLDRMPIAA